VSFVDRVEVDVWAGSGGNGASSFARFKFKAKGGPDGGNGGHGGSVFVRADSNLATLLDYRYRALWRAERGGHGKGKNMTGATASDVYMPVPPGTVIMDADTGASLGEVLRNGDTVRVARGGRGGRGNASFATSTHRAPRESEEGRDGEHRHLVFELKLIADVGLVGEPNAGKSTLLAAISAARPKIADYPFTTLEPNLGVVGLSGSRSFVVADIPGIIEGAHAGKGLGLRFLRHVERTRLLAYLIPLDSEDVQATYDRLRQEVELYGEALSAKPHLVVLTKSDLLPEGAALPALNAPAAADRLAISSAAGQGLDALKELLWKQVQVVRAAEDSDEPEPADQHATPPWEWEADPESPGDE
jgi:GTP-binding protein